MSEKKVKPQLHQSSKTTEIPYINFITARSLRVESKG